MVLLSVGLFHSCGPTRPDPRDDLVRSLKGASVEGFQFSSTEDSTEESASLTNSAVRDLIRLDGAATSVVLRYTRVRDKAANTARTFKTEVTREGSALSLLVTDVGTNEVVSRERFPAPTIRHQNGFDTLQDCLREFDCVNRGPLQCEANRTCEDQFAAITCCLNNGQCFSVHLIIRPTTLRCKLKAVIPDLEGLVLSQ
jgi:hypothetical protein